LGGRLVMGWFITSLVGGMIWVYVMKKNHSQRKVKRGDNFLTYIFHLL
jgi:hypothetical protein